jgi:hypothetical protein
MDKSLSLFSPDKYTIFFKQIIILLGTQKGRNIRIKGNGGNGGNVLKG